MKITFQNLLTGLVLFCCGLQMMAQPGTWAWMKGPQTGNCVGMYGILGVPAPTNEPPCLYECAHWTDLAGNFWLFGGLESGAYMYAAMWRYEPATNNWTWMNGPQASNVSGVYGTQGIPAPGNFPGARSYGPNCWVDHNGDLWMLGGYGYDAFGNVGVMNDLWKYDVGTNQWTWMKGPNTGNALPVYGIMGVPSPLNLPPPAGESNATWVDASNNLWFFGGVDDSYFPYDQVWRYNTSTNEWTWMMGNTLGNIPPFYGTLGVSGPSNNPGSRGTYSAWQDCAGDFWMYGGATFQGDAYGDLWKLDPNTVEWTWMGGPSQPNLTSTFTSLCTPSSTAHPGSRWENRAVWTDQSGRFWCYGGAKNSGGLDTGSDLWCYDPMAQSFTWAHGPQAVNSPVVFGTQGVGAPGNVPGSRAGSSSWQDLQGNFWQFGGYEFMNNTTLGDLWKYTPDPQCPASGGSGGAASAAFTAQPTNGCLPLPVTFTNASTGSGIYLWDFGDGGQSAAANPSHTYLQPGNYAVMLIAQGSCGGLPDTAYATITVGAGPSVTLGPDQTICFGDSVMLDPGPHPGATYLWSDNSTGQTLAASTSGTYWVQVTDSASCIGRDSVVVTVLSTPFSLGPDRNLCTGGSLLLDAGNPGATYLWSNGDQTQTIIVTTGGNHWVEVTLPSGCSLRDTVAITLLPLPVVDLGPDLHTCVGTTALLDAGTHPGASLVWSTGANTQTVTATTAGDYWVQVTDGSGCIGRDTLTLVLDPLPSVALGPDTSLCEGSSLTLDAGNPGGSYLWSTGATSQTLTVTQAGTYSVSVTSVDGCSASASTIVSFTPDFSVSLGADTVFCEAEQWTLATGHPGLDHLWSTGEQTPSITVTTSGTYSVQVANVCFVHGDVITLSFRSDSAGPFVPTAFTPNGDGLNDVLTVGGLHTDDAFSMRVFDRWGMQLYASEDSRQGWDGTFKGLACPEGIYVIWVQVTDCRGTSRPRSTSVSLMR